MSVTPDGRRAVSGSGGPNGENTLRVWDLASGACLHTLTGHNDTVASVSVTLDGRRAVSGSADNTLRLWDLESGVCLRTISGQWSSLRIVRLTPDGRSVVSGGYKTLRVVDLKSGQCLCEEIVPTGVSSVALANRGNTICAGTQAGEVLFFDIQGMAPGPDIVPDTSDEGYQQLLLRGLEFTRREKGNDHEETLAHLDALAVHLQSMGKSDEASQFTRERDQLVSHRAATKAWDTE